MLDTTKAFTWLATVMAAAFAVPSAAEGAEVAFGKNHEMIVDGKLFLPVHAWAGATEDLDRLKAMGVNLILGFGDASMSWKAISDKSIAEMKRSLDECRKRNMYGAIIVSSWWAKPENRGIMKDKTLADYMRLFKDHPALLGWQISVEDDMGLGRAKRKKLGVDHWMPRPGGKPEDLKMRYETVKKADPKRPVIIMHSGGQVISGLRGFGWTVPTPEKWYFEASQHCEILYHDLFPVANNTANDLKQIADATRLLKKYSRGKKHLWVAVDAGDRKRWTTKSHAPTAKEIRNELWQAIINGAHGLGFDYTSWKPTWASIRMDPAAEKQLGPEMATIQSLKEPILLGESTTLALTSTSDKGEVEVLLRKHKDKLYVFATNVQPQACKAEFNIQGLKATKATVIGETRSVEIAGGKFSDPFDSHAVHLYEIELD